MFGTGRDVGTIAWRDEGKFHGSAPDEASLVAAQLLGIPSLMMFDWVYWWAGRRWGGLRQREGNVRAAAMLQEQMSHVLAKELGAKGITVNVISPGPTDTELFGQGKTEQDKQRFAQLAALGRLGQPQDIADVVALLVSDEARWITGQNIRANGGLI